MGVGQASYSVLDHTWKKVALNNIKRGREKRARAKNACTRSCVEGYWGNIGAKMQFLHQKHPENHPEIHPCKSGAGLGCVTVSQLSVIPQEPPKDTWENLSLSPLQVATQSLDVKNFLYLTMLPVRLSIVGLVKKIRSPNWGMVWQ